MSLFSPWRAGCLLAAAVLSLPGASVANIDGVPLAFSAAGDSSTPRYSAHGRGLAVELTIDTAYILLEKARLPIRVTGASAKAFPMGVDPLPGKANYLIGNDSSKWRTGVPTFAKVAYRGVLPGIDLIYYGNAKRLEYDFEVAPGSDPKSIAMEIGAEWKASVSADGSLSIRTADGATVDFARPVSYQLAADGKRIAVDSAYDLKDANHFGFRLGKYDASKPLVIDPVLVYGTYLGGGWTESGQGIAVDTTGSAYVTGWTFSANFPITPLAAVPSCGAGPDPRICYSPLNPPTGLTTVTYAFVTKFNPQGTQVVYSTYLGGGAEIPIDARFADGTISHSIAVDSAGNAYVAGQTMSRFFPTTANAVQQAKRTGLQTTWPGPCAPPIVREQPFGTYDAFVTKLGPTGSTLLYSTYLGGTNQDAANGIAVNTQGEIYVVGSTHSAKGNSFNFTGCSFDQGQYGTAGFPTTATAAFPEVIDRNFNVRLGFFTKIAANGSIAYSSYIGNGLSGLPQGSQQAQGHVDGNKVAVDSSGVAYITGASSDGLFAGGCISCSSALGNRADAFVWKINPANNSGYGPLLLGGSSSDGGNGIALDSSGNAYVTGTSNNPSEHSTPLVEFPVTVGAYQTSRTNPINNTCPFVAKISPVGATLFSTFVCGNSRNASANAIAVDATTQTPVITGNGDDAFPLVNNFSTVVPTGSGAYVSRLNSAGTNLLFSGFLSNAVLNDNGSTGFGVAVDSQLNAYVTGTAASPTGTMATPGAFDTTPNGLDDVFVSKVSLALTSDCQPNASSQMIVTRGGLRYNGATQRWVQTVSVRNNGLVAINAALTFDSLSSNATLPAADGSTGCLAPAGSPYVNLGNMAPQQTVNTTLQFVNPTNAAINYNTRVLAGSGIR